MEFINKRLRSSCWLRSNSSECHIKYKLKALQRNETLTHKSRFGIPWRRLAFMWMQIQIWFIRLWMKNSVAEELLDECLDRSYEMEFESTVLVDCIGVDETITPSTQYTYLSFVLQHGKLTSKMRWDDDEMISFQLSRVDLNKLAIKFISTANNSMVAHDPMLDWNEFEWFILARSQKTDTFLPS